MPALATLTSRFAQVLERVPTLLPEQGTFLVSLLGPVCTPEGDEPPDENQLSSTQVARYLSSTDTLEFVDLWEGLDPRKQRLVLRAIAALFQSQSNLMTALPEDCSALAKTLIKQRFEQKKDLNGSILLGMSVLWDSEGEDAVYSTSRIAGVIRNATKDMGLKAEDLKLGPYIRSMLKKMQPEITEVGRGDKDEWLVKITQTGITKLLALIKGGAALSDSGDNESK